MITPYSNIISVTTLSNLLLDTYSGAAAAYSLRQLRSAYSGDAIRVRRASDNTEQNIGFVDNELDTSALTTFCSGTNGFVTTWYDQSGNANNATQTTSANQPKIYDSVSGVIQDNGKAAFELDGSDGFVFDNFFSNLNTYSFNVFNPQLDTTYSIFTNNTAVAPIGQSGSTAAIGFQYIVNSCFINGNIFSGNRTDFYNATTNQQNLNTINLNTSIANITSIFNRASIQLSGLVQEVIIYTSDKSSNQTGIEDNINDFYSIY
jgi:hypothetical protein